jgi:hypothetical protein
MVFKINYQKILKSKASIFVSIFFLSIFFFNSFCFAAETVQEPVQETTAHEAGENAENGVVQWSLKHKFLKLDVLASNKAPKADDKFDVVLEGVLRSDSGFQKERLRVFLDDSLISSPEDFIIQTLAKDNRVRFTFAKSNLSYKDKAANLIKIKFVDTELAGNVLADREIPVFFKPRDTFETSPAFGGFFDTQKIVSLKVEIYDDAVSQLTSIESSEISSKLNKSLKVSSDKKKFLLTFEHDPQYIQGESESTFSEKNSVLLNNLKIFSTDANGKRTNVTSKFSFKLKANSTHKFADFSTLITQFTTVGLAYPDIQTLEFIVDVEDYLKKINVFFPQDAQTRSEKNIKISAIQIPLSTINIDKNTIVFYEDTTSNQFSVISDPVNLSSSYDNALNLTTVSAFAFNTKALEKHPLADLLNLRLSINSSQKTSLDLVYELDNIVVNASEIQIPVKLKLNKAKGFFVKNRDLMNFGESKLLDLPFALIVKNSVGVDNDLRGRFNQALIFKFIDSPRFIDKSSATVKLSKNPLNPSLTLKFDYNNSADSSVDGLDLVINLLDATSNKIASARIENFSTLTKKANGIFQRTLTNAELGTAFFTNASAATKVQLELHRDQDYLNRLALDPTQYPVLNEVDTLLLGL